MQLNVLNDLAKAKRRWTENNTIVWVKQHSTMRKPGIVPARSHRASHQGIKTHKPKHFDASNTPERNLSGLWAPVCFCRFTLDPVWHHVSLCPISTFPFAIWQCHCWLLDCVQVSVRMLPVRLALCDLEAPGWGEPWFPHCAFVASWLTDYCMAFLWCCLFALVFLCHTNPLGDTMLSSLLVRFRCLWTGRAGFRGVFWVFVCVLFGFWSLLFAFLFCTVTAQWIMYRSNSVLLYSHCRHDWCRHCINSVNLRNAIVFPAW